jgi:hypothetical protein
MDEFKKYLQHHRDEMDVDTPSEHLLQRIQTQTTVKKKAALYIMIARYAAAACVLAAIGFGLKLIIKTDDKKLTVTAAIEKPAAVNNGTDPVKKERVADSPNNVAAVTIKNIPSHPRSGRAVKKPSLPYQLMYSFEHNYNQLVNLQLKNIRNTPVYGEAPDYFDGFKKALVQIEGDELSIRTHIKDKGLNDALLEQLINVYQEKLNLLKNLQQEINQMNKKLKDNQQPSETLTVHFINI